MARLSKKKLFQRFESAVRAEGWNVQLISPPSAFPARYRIYQEGSRHTVRVYIWNLSPGGKGRPPDEWRIQITSGVTQFAPEPGGKTLILGWDEDRGVFTGFDFSHHTDPLGTSPSIQTKETALDDAAANGFAPYNKGKGELALSFQPEFMVTYINQIEALHGTGANANELAVLEQIADDPDAVNDTDIDTTVATPRRTAVSQVRRKLRDVRFRGRVMAAYGDRCAFCGIQLDLLDAAHILPVDHPDSTDETGNGIALCALHHRAYDRGLVTFDPDFKIRVNTDAIDGLKARHQTGGLADFKKGLKEAIILPTEKSNRPRKSLIIKANKLRNWT